MNKPGFSTRLVNQSIKNLTRVICRVDDRPLDSVPERGPLLLVTNHINFLEVPLIYTHLLPRPVTGFAKAETWDNPLMGRLFDLWEAIPIQRGEADMHAIRAGLNVLAQGHILAVAPEGTRSGDGKMLKGQPGIVILALRSAAPILPVACFGGEAFWVNIRRLKRTDFHLVVGNPFYLKAPEMPIRGEIRRKMVDEIMYQIAGLLPPVYRGHYEDFDHATEDHLYFPEGSSSNISPSG
jgi:1-acyl-sn-glycerol-3-phosphate acyltransferase